MLITQFLKVSVSFGLIYQCDSCPKFRSIHTFLLQQPRWWAKECPQLIFPYNITENSPTLLAHNSVFICPNNFLFGIKTSCMILYRLYQNYGKIDHNLCDYYQLPGDHLSEMVTREGWSNIILSGNKVHEKFPIFI